MKISVTLVQRLALGAALLAITLYAAASGQSAKAKISASQIDPRVTAPTVVK